MTLKHFILQFNTPSSNMAAFTRSQASKRKSVDEHEAKRPSPPPPTYSSTSKKSTKKGPSGNDTPSKSRRHSHSPRPHSKRGSRKNTSRNQSFPALTPSPPAAGSNDNDAPQLHARSMATASQTTTAATITPAGSSKRKVDDSFLGKLCLRCRMGSEDC